MLCRIAICCCLLPTVALAQGSAGPDMSILSPKQWRDVDRSINQALAYLSSEQQPDGAFPTMSSGQPGVTSLCVMAFLANGHLPGEGPHGATLERAVRYVRSHQKESGIIALSATPGRRIGRGYRHAIGKAVAYNHAISGLMLAEVYGMTADPDRDSTETIKTALAATIKMSRWPKKNALDHGGWRYMVDDGYADSDLSITSWELMFLRSSKNAGFEMDERLIEDAVAYVKRCYRPDYGTFSYYTWPKDDRRSRGMAGAGVLALAHAGNHKTPEAQTVGDWILRHGFSRYNQIERFDQARSGWFNDRYHYSVFYCSQAMYQLGGNHWRQFYPATSATLAQNQRPNGAWTAENGEDWNYGPAYTTALATLALSAPNQILPIFQR